MSVSGYILWKQILIGVCSARNLLEIYIMKEKRRKQNWADGEVELQFNNNRFLTSLVGHPGVSTAC